MSADNGVYILKTPMRPVEVSKGLYRYYKGYEYRVAHCQAIENIDESDLYLAAYFGDSEIFWSYADAFSEAKRIADKVIKCGPLEYGVANIVVDNRFPNLTAAQARAALSSYNKLEELPTAIANEIIGAA